MRTIDTEVLVIGGGATGAGIARDLAMRGFRTLLVERNDWATGTTGRFNGLMHSGSRYSLKDLHTARECIRENLILRRIMPHCIEDTGAYAVATPDDDPDFGDVLLDRCHEAGVPIEEASPGELLRREPLINPGIKRCFRLLDTPADSFLATQVNVLSARQHGARTLNYHDVTQIVTNGNAVSGAVVRDRMSGEDVHIRADLVVNATGAWAGRIAAMAGIHIPIVCSKGSMIAVHQRLINVGVLRLRWPSDNDSVLPNHSITVLGCNDVVVDGPDDTGTQPAEIHGILEECGKMVPAARSMRLMRVWAGVRPLLPGNQPNGDATGRELSRTHAVFDHLATHGLGGFVSIVGGKWTTYRLMAEQVADEVCRKLTVERPCRTHLELLPGAEGKTGSRRSAPLAKTEDRQEFGQLVCECELVTRSDVDLALRDEQVHTIDDLRRATRLGMGTCQAGYCSYRVAGLMRRLRPGPAPGGMALLRDFVEERWKGVRPIVAGDQLRQSRHNEAVFCDVLGMDNTPPATIGVRS